MNPTTDTTMITTCEVCATIFASSVIASRRAEANADGDSRSVICPNGHTTKLPPTTLTVERHAKICNGLEEQITHLERRANAAETEVKKLQKSLATVEASQAVYLRRDAERSRKELEAKLAAAETDLATKERAASKLAAQLEVKTVPAVPEPIVAKRRKGRGR